MSQYCSPIIDSLVRFFTVHDGGLMYCSLTFFITFLVFYAVYMAVLRGKKMAMQLYVVAFSLFYAYKANGWFMLLLPSTTLVSWVLVEWMKRCRTKGQRKLIATLDVILALSPLVFFKYTNFTLQTLNSIIASNFSPLEIFLPVGLSFYTFQAISYIVDVYKGKFKENATLLEYTFFLTFFPLLIAGPITRPETLIPQLKNKVPIDRKLIYSGLFLVISGILKKGLVADYIAQFNNWVFDDPGAYSGYEALMALVGYTVQIYCDFSGYSDFSIGIAALMGIRLLPNFNSPYRSLNLTEFWHRWHIALSTWFRDYIYIPLGGNRKGKLRTYFNNFITMLFAGWWHGASWMFISWGAIHGAGLMLHKASRPWLERLGNGVGIRFCSWLLTFAYVMFAWIFFRSESMAGAGEMIIRIFTETDFAYFWPFCTARPLWMMLTASALILHLIIREDVFYWFQDRFIKMPWIVKLLVFIIAVQLVINFKMESVNPFIYAQF